MMDLIKEGYVDSGDYFGGLAQVYLFAVIGAVPTIIAMAKGAKHMVTTAKMRSAYAPVSAPAAASVQMPVQPASSPTAPQNVEKDNRKVKFKNHRPQATVFRACGRFFTSFLF